MSILDAIEIKRLVSKQEQLCVSLYMPTHRRGREVDQDPIRLKNLLRSAEDRLVQSGARPGDVSNMLRPARDLLESRTFWRHQSDGLALFMAPGEFLEYRLPIGFDELVVVTDRYHIKPLLPLVTVDGRFFVLVFSQKDVRLLLGTRQGIGEIDARGIPSSLKETLDPDRYQSSFQSHTGGHSRGGKRDMAFHGVGGSEADRKESIERFFRQLDRGVCDLLGEQRAPLVLAGVDYLRPIYREVSKYPALVEGGISGNHDDSRVHSLHTQAWEKVEPLFRSRQDRAWQRYLDLSGTGSGQVSSKIEEIVQAAVGGRVETLFFGEGLFCWGSFDTSSGEVSIHDRRQIGGRDLLNYSVFNTISQGGEAFGLPPDNMPQNSPMVAVLRY